jgi:hypothetical protein
MGKTLGFEHDLPQERFQERHYSVAQIAELWGLSPDAVRKIFEREPGVLVIGNDGSTRGKRGYHTLRIPESVMERLHRRLSNPDIVQSRIVQSRIDRREPQGVPFTLSGPPVVGSN